MTSMNGLSLELGKYQKQVDIRLKQMQKQNFVLRLWNKDEELWKKDRKQKESGPLPLGWLNIIPVMMNKVSVLENFHREVQEAGFTHVVLLGMGGSSLAPFVMAEATASKRSLPFYVLDSTDPETIWKIEGAIAPASTLFIVSSKSGSTAEVNSLFSYFYKNIFAIKGKSAGENFIGITDKDSPLQRLGDEKKFRKVFINPSDIGGRFSALSYFGLIPAALMGIDVKELLNRSHEMMKACGPGTQAAHNPGVVLGTAIAELALRGRDKLTYIIPPRFASFGLWLEQLLAESTGKQGKGILPLAGSAALDLDSLGKDRLLLRYRLEGEEALSPGMEHPILDLEIHDELDLGKEFFRWEIATATAGTILGVDPFDQPNVEESKKLCKQVLASADSGKLSEPLPSLTENSIHFYSTDTAENGRSLLSNFFSGIYPGDYIGLLAYLPQSRETDNELEQMCRYIQERFRLPVSKQFGPRYLHSTGQYHKGGPANGAFIQFVSNSPVDLRIPEKPYSFGMLKRAQAFGDMQALQNNQRRVILVDVGENHVQALQQFRQLMESTANIQKQEVARVYSVLNKEENVA